MQDSRSFIFCWGETFDTPPYAGLNFRNTFDAVLYSGLYVNMSPCGYLMVRPQDDILRLCVGVYLCALAS